ncbi:MAG TPA: DUF2795 domain-containing protein [Gaiellaceae bacterium]|nr:DUF2795 domain-containing protein [Gaiellaceae bacterium]
MDPATAAELKTVLVGVRLPAERSDLLEYAVRQHAEPQLLDGLRSLSSGRQYQSLDEVVDELLQVQPERGKPVPHEPKEEAGRPPGGDAYTEQDPRSGAVRL